MQTLGTKWAGYLIQPDLWLDIWNTRSRVALGQGTVVINGSVRFENEGDAIRKLGGIVVGLAGRDGDLAADHKSEADAIADVIVQNAGTPTETTAAVLAAVRDYLAMIADAFARHG
ncbi:MAG: hypothetical protein JKY94_16515 [Rhodobacteraceae bacterium]|nr:hypothetical protein [Paracoccaceae bacterium]